MKETTTQTLTKTTLNEESDLVYLRQRVRLISSILGFENQDQTRISTSVSEIARNAFQYAGGGIAEIGLVDADLKQQLVVTITDRGKGIPNLHEILQGKYKSKTGMGLGIVGTRKLMDRVEFETATDAGTKVTMAKYLPYGVERAGHEAIKRIQIDLTKATSADPYREMQQQNHQLLSTMAALSEKKTELAAINQVLTEERELHEKFIATLTHDLRSPLTTAKMAAEIILRSKSLGEREKDMANRIVTNIDRTDLMIQDMLNMSSIKAGQGMPTFFSFCNLSTLIDQIIENFKPTYGDRIKKLNSNAKSEGFWDEDNLKRAIENLITNAVKYGAKNRAIEVFLTNPSPAQISINVRNWGNVIPQEEQKNLFDQFKRTDSAKTGGQVGWGLGLSLVKSVAEAHRGLSKVTSSLEHGTVFSIQIPLDSRQP